MAFADTYLLTAGAADACLRVWDVRRLLSISAAAADTAGAASRRKRPRVATPPPPRQVPHVGPGILWGDDDAAVGAPSLQAAASDAAARSSAFYLTVGAGDAPDGPLHTLYQPIEGGRAYGINGIDVSLPAAALLVSYKSSRVLTYDLSRLLTGSGGAASSCSINSSSINSSSDGGRLAPTAAVVRGPATARPTAANPDRTPEGSRVRNSAAWRGVPVASPSPGTLRGRGSLSAQNPSVCFDEFGGHFNNSFYLRTHFSPCGRYIVAGSQDRRAYVWELPSRPASRFAGIERGSYTTPSLVLCGHEGEVSDVAWGGGVGGIGHRIATCADDGTVRLWTARSRRDSFDEDGGEAGRHVEDNVGSLYKPCTNTGGVAALPMCNVNSGRPYVGDGCSFAVHDVDAAATTAAQDSGDESDSSTTSSSSSSGASTHDQNRDSRLRVNTRRSAERRLRRVEVRRSLVEGRDFNRPMTWAIDYGDFVMPELNVRRSAAAGAGVSMRTTPERQLRHPTWEAQMSTASRQVSQDTDSRSATAPVATHVATSGFAAATVVARNEVNGAFVNEMLSSSTSPAPGSSQQHLLRDGGGRRDSDSDDDGAGESDESSENRLLEVQFADRRTVATDIVASSLVSEADRRRHSPVGRLAAYARHAMATGALGSDARGFVRQSSRLQSQVRATSVTAAAIASPLSPRYAEHASPARCAEHESAEDGRAQSVLATPAIALPRPAADVRTDAVCNLLAELPTRQSKPSVAVSTSSTSLQRRKLVYVAATPSDDDGSAGKTSRPLYPLFLAARTTRMDSTR